MASEDGYSVTGHCPRDPVNWQVFDGTVKNQSATNFTLQGMSREHELGLAECSVDELWVNAGNNVHMADLAWQYKPQTAVFSLFVVLHGG